MSSFLQLSSRASQPLSELGTSFDGNDTSHETVKYSNRISPREEIPP